MTGKVLAVMGLLGMFGFGGATSPQADNKAPAGQVCTLKVEGMHCSACASKVEKEARKIGGVTAAKVSQPKGTAEIAYDPAKTTPETIAKTITQKTGFKVSAAQPDDKK